MESVVVLGLGNILYADEGFGVRVAEYLYERFVFPMNAEIVDAGTQGHTLLHYVERADRLLLLDAVDFGLDPGSLIVRDSTGIPAYLSAQKMSLHQNSFSEILALAEFRNRLPQEIRLIGFQPADLRYGKSLSISARSELPRAADLALTTLRQWGIFPEKRLTSEEFQDQSISLRAF